MPLFGVMSNTRASARPTAALLSRPRVHGSDHRLANRQRALIMHDWVQQIGNKLNHPPGSGGA